jgi:hypothetical protein
MSDERSLTNPTANVPDMGTPAPMPTPAMPLPPANPNDQPTTGQSAVPAGPMPGQNGGATVQENHDAHHPIAAKIRGVAETMTGGPRYTTTVDADGNTIRTKVPVSPAMLGLSLALQVLSGGLAAGDAPNSVAAFRAGQANAQKAQAAVKAANQEQDEKAQSDQKYKLAVTETNLRTHLLAQQVGASDKAISQTLSDAYKPLTDGLMDGTVPATMDKPVFETDAMAAIQNGKTNVTRDLLLPVGDAQPVMENGVQKTLNGVPLWGHNYIVVHDADKLQTRLTDDMKQKLQSIGYFRNPDGSSAEIGNPQWSFADLSKKMSEYAAVQAGEAMLNQHLNDAHEYLGTDDKDIPKLKDLATEVRNDPTMRKAIQNFSRYGGTFPVDVILYNMNQTDPQGAAKIMGYLGLTPKMLGDMADARAKEEAEAKNVKTPAPKETAEAARFTLGKANGGKGVNPNQPVVNGMQNGYKLSADEMTAYNALNGEQESKRNLKTNELNDQRAIQNDDIAKAAHTMVDDPYNIASIRTIASMKGDERLRLFNAATDYAKATGKTFDQSAADRKAKMLDSYENGKQADNIQSYQTFIKHAGDLYSTVQSLDRPEGTPKWIDKPLTWLEQNASSDPAIGAYLAKFEPVRDEILTFLKNNHAALQMDAESMAKVLDPSQSPAYIESAVKSLATTGQYRLDSINSRFKHEFKKDFDGLYDDESRDALKTIGVSPLGVKPPNPADVVGSGTLNNQKVFKLKNGDTVYANGEKVQ